MEFKQEISWSNRDGSHTGVNSYGETQDKAFDNCMDSAIYFGYTDPKWWQWWRWGDIDYNYSRKLRGES